MHRTHTIAAGTVAAALLGTTLAMTPTTTAFAASHREAPSIA